MTIAHLLENFGIDTTAEPALPTISEELAEEQRLASFESGYTAGWEDAVAAKDKESSRISAELASSLEDLNFTYHEAQNQLLESLDPMFKVLTSAILPDAMAASFGHHIVDQLSEMAKGRTDQPMQIMVSPAKAPRCASCCRKISRCRSPSRKTVPCPPGRPTCGLARRNAKSTAMRCSKRSTNR